MSIDKNKIPIILLLGEGHSGSTLIDVMMNSHPDVVGVGEISHYCRSLKMDGICSCGEGLKRCSFWKKIFDGLDCSIFKLPYRKKIDFLLNRTNYFYFEGDKEYKFDSQRYTMEVENLFRRIQSVSGKRVIFDSSKTPERAELILGNDNLDILILHLVRDGKGVVYSNYKLGRNPFYFMRRWMSVNLRIEIIKMRQKNIKIMFVHYDDLIKRPEYILNSILKNFDLKFSKEMFKSDGKYHQVGGNSKSRFFNDISDIKYDKVWEKKLGLLNKIIFNVLFGWLNIFYKYKPRKY